MPSNTSHRQDTSPDTHQMDPFKVAVQLLHANPQNAYEQFCKHHQHTHHNVKLATLMQNNMHQADFLNRFYQHIVNLFKEKEALATDEEFVALVSYFHNHMVNVSCYDNYSHSHNGTQVTKTGKEARTASFEYCIQELLPQIQKRLRQVE